MTKFWAAAAATLCVAAALPALAFASVSVSIQSLSPSTNISVGTNLSFQVAASGFTNPTYSVSDSFSGSSVSNSNIDSSGDFSWTPEGNDIGTHTLTVSISDSQGDSATTQESIVVSAAPSLSIQSLSPGSSIAPGTTLSFFADASGFTNPTYSVSDSFSGSSVSSSDINSSGDFSWTPNSNDAGSHAITVTVSDSQGHNASASETVQVSQAQAAATGPTIQGLEPGSTVVIGNPATFTVAASGFSNPVFSVSDSFGGSSVSNADINSAGYFSWTPDSNDVGTHNLTLYANDSSGHSGNVELSLTVEEPNISVTSINPGTTVLPNSPLTFTVTPAGFVNPTYTVSDSFSGSSITNSNITTSGSYGDFSWTPATDQSGTHAITIYATDSEGHSANTSITIDVNSGVSVSLTAPSPNSSVVAGTPVSFQAYAYGFTNPAYSLSDSFEGTTLTSADINASGAFSWTPTNADAGTHMIIVTATDAYGHESTAETTVTVAENANAPATTALSSGSVDFTDYLYPGLTSPQVTDLQATLEALGFFSGPITGYYGSLTQAAVESFQSSYNIDPVGDVGPQTRAELNSLLSGSSSASSSATSVGDGYVFSNFIGYGETSTDVTELQKRLTALGVYSGPITGYFGDLTQAAVESFQAAHGIEQVGYVGPATRAALNQ